MTIDELAANRDWLTEIRPIWEAERRLPEIEGLPATNEGLVQCMMRLLNLTLDYYTAGQGGISKEDHQRLMSVAATLGKEWTAVMEALPHEERIWAVNSLPSLYPIGIAWIVTRTATDPKLTWFVGCVLLVWGAFSKQV